MRGHDGSVHDPERQSYLEAYLAGASRAVAQGVPLRGYFAWSLLDNFEWAWGYWKRFGLIYIDYATLERVPKGSFYWYRDFIAAQNCGEHSKQSFAHTCGSPKRTSAPASNAEANSTATRALKNLRSASLRIRVQLRIGADLPPGSMNQSVAAPAVISMLLRSSCAPAGSVSQFRFSSGSNSSRGSG